eukprot:2791305-Heterocapsa_arctica.AAC.1
MGIDEDSQGVPEGGADKRNAYGSSTQQCEPEVPGTGQQTFQGGRQRPLPILQAGEGGQRARILEVRVLGKVQRPDQRGNH